MLTQEYWNNIGFKKDFEDPLYTEKLAPHISKESVLVEYGCGYGRMLKPLQLAGYKNLTGFDFAPNMIQRGKTENPDLDLRLLAENKKIPLLDQSVDGLFMSTVLCSMVNKNEQLILMDEISRVLKSDGILYLTDFMICNHPSSKEKYSKGLMETGEWGMYTTSEGLTVRHYTTSWIMEILKNFDIQWFEQFDFKTMNNNPARTFHCIAKKRI